MVPQYIAFFKNCPGQQCSEGDHSISLPGTCWKHTFSTHPTPPNLQAGPAIWFLPSPPGDSDVSSRL